MKHRIIPTDKLFFVITMIFTILFLQVYVTFNSNAITGAIFAAIYLIVVFIGGIIMSEKKPKYYEPIDDNFDDMRYMKKKIEEFVEKTSQKDEKVKSDLKLLKGGNKDE